MHWWVSVCIVLFRNSKIVKSWLYNTGMMIDVPLKLFHAVRMGYCRNQHTRRVSIKRLAFWLFFILPAIPFTIAARENNTYYPFTYDCPPAYHHSPSYDDSPPPYECNWAENLYYDIKRDFTIYLRPKNLLLLGDALVVGGILANTRIDRSIRNTWQDSVRSSGTNNFFAVPQAIGGFSYWYHVVYPAAVALGYYTRNSPAGNVLYFWGYRALRTALLGGIQQAFFTQALGSGRPINHVDSKWQPYTYKTGVSGHSFYGSIPFITAAMMSDNPLIRYSLYVMSTLPGISRINSDNHYTSQVFLGWAIAFLSARAIHQSDEENESRWCINACPYPVPGKNNQNEMGVSVSAHYRF